MTMEYNNILSKQILPGRKIHLGNSIDIQMISQGEDTNHDVQDQPKEWQILQLHNTTCAMFQYKNQLQDYLEEFYVDLNTIFDQPDPFLSKNFIPWNLIISLGSKETSKYLFVI